MRRALSLVQPIFSIRSFALVFAVILSGIGGRAEAQVRDVEPYHIVVTGDRVYLRCGAGGVWYAIGYASTGEVLRVDGEDFKWVRVRYPEGVPALVSIEEADYNRERGVVTITRPSRLKAHNIHGQRFGDSWKNLLMQPINPGTELKHVDTLRDAGGQVEGYLVEAPASARAFISEQYTRRATPSEIAAWQAAQRAKSDVAQTPPTQTERPMTQTAAQQDAPNTSTDRPAIAEPQSTTTAQRPANERAEEVTTQTPTSTETTTAATNQPTTPPATDESTTPTEVAQRDETPVATPAPTQPSAQPETRETRTAGAPTPDSAPSGDATPSATESTTTAQRPGGEAADEPAAPKVATFEELESAFVALAEQPTEDAEIEPLIGEYKRFRDALPDTEDNQAWFRRVDNRIAILEVRRDLQVNLRALNETSAEAGVDEQAIQQRLAQLDRTRPYALVGRLTASAIYDGKRLPLMYRLQSVDAGGGRTIAYLVPSQNVDLKARLGSIVGVEGQSRVDPALKLRIVQPSRVDLLTPALTRVTEPDQP